MPEPTTTDPTQQTTTAQPGAAVTPPAPPPAQSTGFRGTATGEQVADDDDDDQARPTVGRGGQQMDATAISERLARQERRLLRQHYGTDDPAQIEEIKRKNKERDERLAALETERQERAKKEEDAKREKMTREEQLAADLAKKDAEILALKNQVQEARTESLTTQQDQIVTRVALKYVDESMLDAARVVLAKHVRGLSKVEQRRFNDKRLDQWFARLVKDNPRYARELPAPKPADQTAEAPKTAVAAPKPVRRVPVGGTRPGTKPAPRPRDQVEGSSGKTVRPGLPNSMTKKELNAHLRSNGMRPW